MTLAIFGELTNEEVIELVRLHDLDLMFNFLEIVDDYASGDDGIEMAVVRTRRLLEKLHGNQDQETSQGT